MISNSLRQTASLQQPNEELPQNWNYHQSRMLIFAKHCNNILTTRNERQKMEMLLVKKQVLKFRFFLWIKRMKNRKSVRKLLIKIIYKWILSIQFKYFKYWRNVCDEMKAKMRVCIEYYYHSRLKSGFFKFVNQDRRYQFFLNSRMN